MALPVLLLLLNELTSLVLHATPGTALTPNELTSFNITWHSWYCSYS